MGNFVTAKAARAGATANSRRPTANTLKTRQAVLEGARDLFAEKGGNGFTVEGVTALTGIAKTTIYRHWPSRDALLQEVLGDGELPPSGRELVLDAAAALLADRGAAGFSIDSIVEQTRVSKSTIYRYWINRSGLIGGVIDRIAKTSPTPDTGSLREDLIHFFRGDEARAAGHWQQRDRCFQAILEMAKSDPELTSARHQIWRAMHDAMEPLLIRGRERGEIGAHVDLEVTALLLLSGVSNRNRFEHHLDQHFVERVLDTLFKGIAPPAKAASSKRKGGRRKRARA